MPHWETSSVRPSGLLLAWPALADTVATSCILLANQLPPRSSRVYRLTNRWSLPVLTSSMLPEKSSCMANLRHEAANPCSSFSEAFSTRLHKSNKISFVDSELRCLVRIRWSSVKVASRLVISFVHSGDGEHRVGLVATPINSHSQFHR